MSIVDRVDRLQRERPALGFPIAVLYKYIDDQGSYLAALIAYYAFVSLFPLLLLATTILGIVLVGHPALEKSILTSAVDSFPVVSKDLKTPKSIGGGVTGLVVGIVGSLYGALGVAQAGQNAMNVVWRVPRNSRPNPFKARGRSLILLATAGVGLIATTALSTFASGALASLGPATRTVTLAVSVLMNAALFVFGFRIATTRDLSVRDVAVGAVAAAVIWQLLQTFGVAYVQHVVSHASSTNAVFAIVLGLLAFLYLTATAVVFCAEVNAVRVDRLSPRALLTPFTDNVSLSPGDRRSYTSQATAARSKGFEQIDVTFHENKRDGDDTDSDSSPDQESSS